MVGDADAPPPQEPRRLRQPFPLAEAAELKLLLSLRCLKCRRPPVLFLATDLVQILDPDRDCFIPPPFPCSACGSAERVAVTLRSQDDAAVGRLVVRRLRGVRRVPVWRNELLGDNPG